MRSGPSAQWFVTGDLRQLPWMIWPPRRGLRFACWSRCELGCRLKCDLITAMRPVPGATAWPLDQGRCCSVKTWSLPLPVLTSSAPAASVHRYKDVFRLNAQGHHCSGRAAQLHEGGADRGGYEKAP